MFVSSYIYAIPFELKKTCKRYVSSHKKHRSWIWQGLIFLFSLSYSQTCQMHISTQSLNNKLKPHGIYPPTNTTIHFSHGRWTPFRDIRSSFQTFLNHCGSISEEWCHLPLFYLLHLLSWYVCSVFVFTASDLCLRSAPGSINVLNKCTSILKSHIKPYVASGALLTQQGVI